MENDSWFKIYIMYLQRKCDFKISQLSIFIGTVFEFNNMAMGESGWNFQGSTGPKCIKVSPVVTRSTAHIKKCHRASLVAQWLRICLLMQGTRVRALVWEDPTRRGATGPVSHNYWACASGACAPQQERPRKWEARAPRWRVAPTCRN